MGQRPTAQTIGSGSTATAKRTRTRSRRLRRGIQALSLGLFLCLIAATVSPGVQSLVPVDLYLRLDPLVAALIPLAAREWIAALWPGLGILLLALFAGRIFCGYLCPMGITLDIANWIGERLLGKPRGGKAPADAKLPQTGAGAPTFRLRWTKYLLLAGLLAAALLGVNLIFWAAPIPLITRLYALLLHPVLTFLGYEGLSAVQPALAWLDVPGLGYLQIFPRRFDTLYFLLAFFAVLFALERVKPRFWCRYLCPAGALLGLFSLRPWWRRRVRGCEGCGSCVRHCPTGAIHADGVHSDFAECLACRTCEDSCPTGGVRFALRELPATGGAGETGGNPLDAGPEVTASPQGRRAARPLRPLTSAGSAQHAFLPSRRYFLTAAGAGAGLALVGYSGVDSLLLPPDRGSLWSEGCIRPPGALPEPAFLDRCLRCGQCMKVCPTNGLQPAWFAAGVEGMFSPILAARRGPCEPDCKACGSVCPTGAIQALPLEEKRWAKVGTAVVAPGYCLAWAENRACVVCEEVCPYGAIKCEQRSGAVVPVPVVKAERCYGCGYCEQHCPVRIPAIVVRPLNALRLTGSNYQETAQGIGLTLIPASKNPEPKSFSEDLPEGALPPGFTD